MAAAGVGGLMQSLVYGYGGLRILAGMVRLRPTPMDSGAWYTLHNIKYAGWALTLEVGPEHVTLTAAQMESMLLYSIFSGFLYVQDGPRGQQ
jgi:trehalose/maltose hydrolase-like predicted phosphorylase